MRSVDCDAAGHIILGIAHRWQLKIECRFAMARSNISVITYYLFLLFTAICDGSRQCQYVYAQVSRDVWHYRSVQNITGMRVIATKFKYNELIMIP